MKKVIKKLAEVCKEAIEQAARESYADNPCCFDGCSCLMDLQGDDQIEVYCDSNGKCEVLIYKRVECLNVEKALEAYLDANADPEGAWQEEFDGDMWKDVEPGCDPAFPHRGDFERWAYGR